MSSKVSPIDKKKSKYVPYIFPPTIDVICVQHQGQNTLLPTHMFITPKLEKKSMHTTIQVVSTPSSTMSTPLNSPGAFAPRIEEPKVNTNV
jgi:hypothetical protein